MPYLTTTPAVSVAVLSERVYQALVAEHPASDGPQGLIYDRAEIVYPPKATDREIKATDREMDLMDWGFAYGIAYALARVEAHPFDDVELSVQRAGEAAWAAYQRYGTSIAPAEDRLNEPGAAA